MPIFTVPIHESNDCHNPAGPGGGQFCSGEGFPRTGLGAYPYAEGSRKIPGYLKMDVLRARQAGIEVFNGQQPEPVADIYGNLHDPLAKSHARRGSTEFSDVQGRRFTAPAGRIYISTRGGEFEPDEQVWDNYGPRGYKKKDLTPDMLKDPATVEDVVSTFRHEMGHLVDKSFGGGGAKTPVELAREIRAWQYAVEVSPDHTVSTKMAASGLMSHAYHVFRGEAFAAEMEKSGRKVWSWDRAETLNRMVQNETRSGILDIETHRKAEAFTQRVLKALAKYGEVLRKKGLVRVRQPRDYVWFPKRTVTPGPGGRGWL